MTGLEPMKVLIVPLTGEVISLAEPEDVCRALDEVREMKRQLDDVRAVLEDALRLESERQGTKTLHFDDLTAVITGGEKVEYDTERLRDLLREEGLPEKRLGELIVAMVTYKVNAAVARSVAAANPRYALALEACKQVVPAPWRVSVKR